MSVEPLLPTLSELRNLPEEERARLRAIEDSIQDRLLASLDAARREGGDPHFVQRAIVPVLLAMAARAYSDIAEGLEPGAGQFVSMARDSLEWANDRGAVAAPVKH